MPTSPPLWKTLTIVVSILALPQLPLKTKTSKEYDILLGFFICLFKIKILLYNKSLSVPILSLKTSEMSLISSVSSTTIICEWIIL